MLFTVKENSATNNKGLRTASLYKFWLLEFCHFDGDDGALITLVAVLATCTIAGLLEVVGGEEAEDDGDVARGVETGDTLCDALTDVVEVGRLAADDAAEDDHGVVAVVEGHLTGAVDELEGAGHRLHVDVLWQGTMLLEGGDAAFEEGSRDLGIPLGHDHAEDHVRRIGHLREVVVAEVMECCGHLTWMRIRARYTRRCEMTSWS